MTADHATKIMSNIETVQSHLEGVHQEQEVHMFDVFAEEVARRKHDNGQVPFEHYWNNIALATQAVLDACYLSAKQGGVEINLASNVFQV